MLLQFITYATAFFVCVFQIQKYFINRREKLPTAVGKKNE